MIADDIYVIISCSALARPWNNPLKIHDAAPAASAEPATGTMAPAATFVTTGRL
jgi:hypothetical protein